MSRGLGTATRQDSHLRQLPRWLTWLVAPLFLVVCLFLIVVTFANERLIGGFIVTFLPVAIIAVIWSNARRRRTLS